MSQETTKLKRRWLAQLLRGSASALWMAPALLAPVIMTAAADEALGQAPVTPASAVTAPSQAATPQTASVNDQFVLGWLDYAAANTKDIKLASQAYTEALRGRKLMKVEGKDLDRRVEERLKQVQTQLVAVGVTPKHIEQAASNLGPIVAAPRVAPVQTASATSNLPALPSAPVASPVIPASSASGPTAKVAPAMQLPGAGAAEQKISQGVFWPGRGGNSATAASGQLTPASPIEAGASGEDLYRRGLERLTDGDRVAAYELFKSAWRFEGEMDPTTRAQLKDKLTSMQPRGSSPEQISASPIDQVTRDQMLARQKWMSEVAGEISKAEANREAEPQVVAERLQVLRTRVSQSGLDGKTKKQLLTLVDRQIATHQIYMTRNRAAIEQNLKNQQVRDEIALDQEQTYKTQQQIASLVDSYNDLMDEGRYAEAEVVAKQVGVLDRDSEIASLLIANARTARRILESEEIIAAKEDGFVDALNDVDRSAIPYTDSDGMSFPENWGDISRNRAELLASQNNGMSPADAMIYERLKTPVLVNFKNRPLTEVVDVLHNMTGIPIIVDEVALEREALGSASEIGISLALQSEIQMRSALNIMLRSHGLSYQVRDEVLVISSENDDVKANVTRTYNVKDLVVPIPNFRTDNNSGMAGAIRQAYETASAGRGLIAAAENSGRVIPASYGNAGDMNNPAALGQFNPLAGGNLPPQFGAGLLGGGSSSGPLVGPGPGMMNMGPQPQGGGGAFADFGTLINLIQTTVVPDTWDIQGGPSTIQQYPANLSLVISAPQTTHEKVAELLESLRRLQDLQVTVEVKFITLNDTFFERMGVDFDVKLDDNVTRLPADDSGNSASIGLNAEFNPFTGTVPVTGDLDITLSNNTFGGATPPFGAPDPGTGASLGFAILSDLEMFFFMNAAQGDQRTNVLQAPRVTMFDGQFATVTDTTSRPFVTGLIPVVGDFAVAQQPVIVVLNEGTVLNVQATVSADKRFVRMTINPTFSAIDRVDTFTFEGTRTTRSGTNVLDPAGEVTGETDDVEEIVTGSTVQQPSFAFTNISTTVSVPDGGTILLGGIKRMSEGRVERGIPILSKIPYVNRLFKNTAVGRETRTLMMTVTPRIIIQEEEERKYGVTNN